MLSLPPAVIDVILPVLDEARALPWVLTRDGSAEVARAHGALVVAEPERGFGAACWRGLRAATAEVVCFMDSDASLDPVELARVAGPVLDGDADLVLGARVSQPGAWPAHAHVANRQLARELRRRSGVPLTDLGPIVASAGLWRGCCAQPPRAGGSTKSR